MFDNGFLTTYSSDTCSSQAVYVELGARLDWRMNYETTANTNRRTSGIANKTTHSRTCYVRLACFTNDSRNRTAINHLKALNSARLFVQTCLFSNVFVRWTIRLKIIVLPRFAAELKRALVGQKVASVSLILVETKEEAWVTSVLLIALTGAIALPPFTIQHALKSHAIRLFLRLVPRVTGGLCAVSAAVPTAYTRPEAPVTLADTFTHGQSTPSTIRVRPVIGVTGLEMPGRPL